jgi:hypothetical protein
MPPESSKPPETIVYLGQRMDELREVISSSSGVIHRRLDDLPDDIQTAMGTAVEAVMIEIRPLIPDPPKMWERPPWNWMIMSTYVFVLVMAGGASITYGILPERLLDQLGNVVSAYFSSISPGDFLVAPAAAAPLP